MPGKLRITLVNQQSEVGSACDSVADFLKARDVPAETVHHVHLCLDEVLTNVVEHGMPPGQQASITVEVRLDAGEVRVEVIDPGRAFDPFAREDPDITLSLEERPIGGLGIYFVKILMDEMEYRREDGHNHTVFIKRLGPANALVTLELDP